MANQKFNHFVSPELTLDAQYKSIGDIPASALTRGTTIFLHPGTYSAISGTWDDLAIVGLGDKAEVVVQGISAGKLSANTLSLYNITVTPAAAYVQGDDSVGVELNGESTNLGMSVVCERVKFTNSNYAIRIHGGGSSEVNYCDLTGADRGVTSNGGGQTFRFSHLTPNVYGDSSNGVATALTVLACGGAGGNVGNTTETIVALIS